MRIRERFLPSGWYPEGRRAVERELEFMIDEESGGGTGSRAALSCIVPHAGWFFSGRISFSAIRGLSENVDTVVVFGGHLPGGAPILHADEDSFDTPLGNLESDKEFLSSFLELSRLAGWREAEDLHPDNTVEIQLPFVKFLYPEARLVWLRIPNSPEAEALGGFAAEAAVKLARKAVAIGSTDLTHYGPNYGFSPAGSGRSAEAWVREKNDRRIVEAFLSMDGEKAVRLGNEEHSACSPGAAAAAIGFAKSVKAKEGRLLSYATSLDVYPGGDSFVGYCGISFI